MTDHITSLTARLLAAESPFHLRDWEGKDGYYVATCRVSEDDIPHLIDLARKWSDPDWPPHDLEFGVDGEDIEMLPITAWRSLADLQAGEAVEPLMDLLGESEDGYDDWVGEELPHVFGKIGAPAIAALNRVCKDADESESARRIAAEALHRMAEYHLDTHDEVVACLSELIKKPDDDIHFNTTVMVGLVELRAVEAAEAIERAFADDRIDVGMMGGWEEVRRELGVEGLGLEMPRHPYNTIEQFRRSCGIGIFSQERLFDLDGQLTEAEEDYYERARDLFSKSEEAGQVVERFGDLGWFRMLLEFGVHCRGEIVDRMTVASLSGFVFDYVPRKVSTEPDAAKEIIFELTKFWEYIARVYELAVAKPIIEWLQSDGLVGHLATELSNPANFGMAKSMFMTGQSAGFDMTSEAGMAEFMVAYNQGQMQSQAESTDIAPSGTIRSEQQRIGRNDPCPCGSGKKYKKCCRKH